MTTQIKSDILSNPDSNIVNPRGSRTAPIIQAATANTGAAVLADNSVIQFFRIPVDALVYNLELYVDDLGDTGLLNLGLYPGNIIISADTDAVDEDCFASSVDLNAAALGRTNLLFEATATNHIQINKRAWERAGLSARPSYSHFVVAGTLAQATTAQGDVTLIMTHTA